MKLANTCNVCMCLCFRTLAVTHSVRQSLKEIMDFGKRFNFNIGSCKTAFEEYLWIVWPTHGICNNLVVNILHFIINHLKQEHSRDNIRREVEKVVGHLGKGHQHHVFASLSWSWICIIKKLYYQTKFYNIQQPKFCIFMSNNCWLPSFLVNQFDLGQ